MKTQSTLRALLLGASFLVSPYVQAATLYWDGVTGGAITDGAGAWLTAGRWNNAGVSGASWTSGDSAIFGYGGAGGAVTLAGTTTVDSLTFNTFTGTYTLGSAGAGNTITLNNGITMNTGGSVTFLSPITLGASQTWTSSGAGALTLNDGTNSTINTNGHTLTFKGLGSLKTFNIQRGAGISGSGSVIVDNAYLDLRMGGNQSTNNYTGTTTVQNGGAILYFGNNIGTGNINLNGGTIEGYFNEGFTRQLGTGSNQFRITGGVSGFGVNGNSTINFSNVTEVQWGSASFSPSKLVLGGGVAGGTVTFAEGIDLNGADRTIISNVGGVLSALVRNTSGTAAGLIKEGAGTLSLTAANTYNGATTIRGGTLTLSGSGTLASTSALNLSGGGTLQLTNAAQLNRFVDAAAITVSSGGGITYTNTSGLNLNYTETLGSVALNAGLLNVNLATNQNNATNNSQILTLAGLARSGTGTVAFSAATTGPQASGGDNMIVVTGAGTTTAGDIIGAWATTGATAALQTDYAVYNSDFVTAANIAVSEQTTWATSNFTMSAVDSGTLSATRNINTLRSTNNAVTVIANNANIALAGHTLSAGDVVTFSATTVPTGLVAGTPYYVVNPAAGTIQVSVTPGGAAITPTTAGAAVVAGGGILVSSGNNLGTTGILNGSATTLNILQSGGAGVVTLPTTTAGVLTMNTGAGGITVTAPITNNTGALTLAKSGSGILILNSVNTFTGAIAINAGTLQIGNNTANGANLNSGTYAGNIFIGAGANLDFQTNVDQTLSGIISGDGNLLKRNVGTLTLGDDNTYTGKTTIGAITNNNSPTLVVSSFNSYNGGTPLLANSSLGAPTTLANATIEMGSNNSTPNPTLRYAGAAATGETTDRIINFTFNSSATRTIDASGSGLLKFTSPFTSSGLNTGGLILTGTGSGEIAGLPFLFGTLAKNGGGTWTIAGSIGAATSVTLSGLTAGSRLNINQAQALGTGTFIISGGNNATIGNTSGADITLTANNAQTWTNNFAVDATNSLNMGTGAVSMGASRTIAVSGAGTYTVGGVVSGATFGITLGGSGTMALTNEASTYTGQTIIGNNAASTLKLQVTKLANASSNSSLGTGAANSLIQIGATSNSSTLEMIGGTSASSTNRQIQIGSSTGGTGGATILNNNINSAHTLTFSNAAFNVAATGITTFNRSLTLGGSNTGDNTIAGVIIPNGSTTGLTDLVKTGAGKWVLTGTNTYTGSTTITGGTLALSGSGSIANSALVNINSTLDVTAVTGNFTIGAAQTYGGGGTILATGKTVVANGTLSPGNSPGTLTEDGGTLQLGANGNMNLQIHDANGIAGTGYDTVNLINGATLDLSLLSVGNEYNINLWSLSGIGPDVNGDATNFDNTQNYAWTLFSTGTAITGFNANLFDINDVANNGTNGFTNLLGGGLFTVGLGDSETDIVLNFTAIPEPKTALLGCLGVILILRRRR